MENFCVHASNGYYNGHIFHRVIKQFMIQTGDPTGMYVCMYICMSVCLFLCLYICMYIMYVCLYVCHPTSMYVPYIHYCSLSFNSCWWEEKAKIKFITHYIIALGMVMHFPDQTSKIKNGEQLKPCVSCQETPQGMYVYLYVCTSL